MSLRLTYQRFKEYLQWMLDRQLVAEIHDEEDHQSEKDHADTEGIDSYRKLVEWINETTGAVKL